jgi:hypothetical protein
MLLILSLVSAGVGTGAGERTSGSGDDEERAMESDALAPMLSNALLF